MRLEATLVKWLDVLAAAGLALREAWRARRQLTIAREDGRFVVQRANVPGDPILAEFPADGSSVSVPPVLNGASAVFVLDPDDVVIRRISVPAQGRAFLDGIVRNQIDRLSPWPAALATHGFRVVPGGNPASLDVEVVLTARAAVDAAREAASRLGVTIDAVVARIGPGRALVTMWTRGAASAAAFRGLRWRIGAALGGVFGLVVALSAWNFFAAGSDRVDAEEAASKAAAIRQRIQRDRMGAASPAPLSAAERAWSQKETAPAAVILLEALSRVLPDDAHLTELRLEGAQLRIMGLASDPPALIAKLEPSNHFSDVHFAAPTTRAAEGLSFRFQIGARVKPQLSLRDE